MHTCSCMCGRLLETEHFDISICASIPIFWVMLHVLTLLISRREKEIQTEETSMANCMSSSLKEPGAKNKAVKDS